MRRYTRRQALWAGVGGAVAATPLAAAGALGQALGDDAIIAAAVGFEQRCALAYERALRTGRLGSRLRAIVTRIARQEAEQAAALQTALEALGGSALPLVPGVGGLEPAGSERQVMQALLELESASVAAYQRAIGRLDQTRLVQTVASIMAAEAQHLVVIRGALGREVIPEPFERG